MGDFDGKVILVTGGGDGPRRGHRHRRGQARRQGR